MALAPTLAWLFAGRILSGIMGASWAAANSCVADTVPAEERGRVFGMLGGLGAFGFVAGPAIGGVLGGLDPRAPFFAAAGLALAGAAAGWFLLQETLPADKRRRFDLGRANPLGTMIQMAGVPVVRGLLLVILVMQLAAQSQLSIWAYYNSLKFGWSPLDIGLSIAFFGLSLALVQGLLVGRAIARFGERRTAIVGLSFGLPCYLLFAFAPASEAMIAGIAFGALTGFAFPAMQQIMTRRVDEDAQGELQGASASTISLTSIGGPVLMSQTFGHYADARGLYFPGAPFLLAFAIIALALVILWRTLTGPGDRPLVAQS